MHINNIHQKHVLVAFVLFFLFIPFENVFSQAGKVDENAIFGEEETVKDVKKLKDDSIVKEVEKESLSVSGFLNSRNFYTMNRGMFLGRKNSFEKNNLNPYFQSNIILDARLKEGIKGIVNVSGDYYPLGTQEINSMIPLNLPIPQSSISTSDLSSMGSIESSQLYYIEEKYSDFAINEVFIDANIRKKVYFRAGKQTLQWGKGIIWNPTDFVNVERKDILNISQVREGAYGLKTHVPFGTKLNLYSFLNVNNADNIDEIASAQKVEFVLGAWEFSVSSVFIKDRIPIYGMDFSTRFLTIDWHGELAISHGDSSLRLKDNAVVSDPFDTSNKYVREIEKRWIPRTVFGFHRSFDAFDLSDRISLSSEFFYNGLGYTTNAFARDRITRYYFIQKGLYHQNYYARFYWGNYFIVRQIFIQNLSFSTFNINNLSDSSSILAFLWQYNPVNNFYISLMLSAMFGPPQREYTWIGAGSSVELSAKLIF